LVWAWPRAGAANHGEESIPVAAVSTGHNPVASQLQAAWIWNTKIKYKKKKEE